MSTVGLLEGLTSAIGQELTRLGGLQSTRVQAGFPVTAGDTTIRVETTLGWESAGYFYLDSYLYKYTGITTNPTYGEFTGVSYFDEVTYISGAAQDHAVLTEIMDYTRAYSAVDKMRRSFLVDYAAGIDLDTLARNIGVLRQPELETTDSIFRNIIKAIAYSPRGTMYIIELYLDALFGVGNYRIFEDMTNAGYTTRLGQLEVNNPGQIFVTTQLTEQEASTGAAYVEAPVRGELAPIVWPNSTTTIYFEVYYPYDHTPVIEGCRLLDERSPRVVADPVRSSDLKASAVGVYDAANRVVDVTFGQLGALNVLDYVRPGDTLVKATEGTAYFDSKVIGPAINETLGTVSEVTPGVGGGTLKLGSDNKGVGVRLIAADFDSTLGWIFLREKTLCSKTGSTTYFPSDDKATEGVPGAAVHAAPISDVPQPAWTWTGSLAETTPFVTNGGVAAGGSSVSFTAASTQYLEGAANAGPIATPNAAFTFSLWFKGNWMPLVGQTLYIQLALDAIASPVIDFGLTADTGGLLGVTMYETAGSSVTAVTTKSYKDTKWHLAVITWDTATLTLRIDPGDPTTSDVTSVAAAAGRRGSAHAPPVASPIFGRFDSGALQQYYWDGYIDEVAYWNTAFNLAQASELYVSRETILATSHSLSANLEAWWRMGEAAGDSTDSTNPAARIYDVGSGGHNIDLTPHNMTSANISTSTFVPIAGSFSLANYGTVLTGKPGMVGADWLSYRQEARVLPDSHATFEAALSFLGVWDAGNVDQVYMEIVDGDTYYNVAGKHIRIGFGLDGANIVSGFSDAAGSFIGGADTYATPLADQEEHVYRIVKDGQDRAYFYVDGRLIDSIAYSDLITATTVDQQRTIGVFGPNATGLTWAPQVRMGWLKWSAENHTDLTNIRVLNGMAVGGTKDVMDNSGDNLLGTVPADARVNITTASTSLDNYPGNAKGEFEVEAVVALNKLTLRGIRRPGNANVFAQTESGVVVYNKVRLGNTSREALGIQETDVPYGFTFPDDLGKMLRIYTGPASYEERRIIKILNPALETSSRYEDSLGAPFGIDESVVPNVLTTVARTSLPKIGSNYCQVESDFSTTFENAEWSIEPTFPAAGDPSIAFEVVQQASYAGVAGTEQSVLTIPEGATAAKLGAYHKPAAYAVSAGEPRVQMLRTSIPSAQVLDPDRENAQTTPPAYDYYPFYLTGSQIGSATFVLQDVLTAAGIHVNLRGYYYTDPAGGGTGDHIV